MRMKLGLVLFFGANLLTMSALATGGGSEAGNGGSSIVCQDASKNITSVELLDFYEARTQRGIKIDLGPATDSVETKVALFVQRLKRLDERIAENLQYQIDSFAANSRFYSGGRLVQVPDSQNLFIPSGCQQEQIAIWREPTVPEDRLYNISQDLWDRLDNDNKAGLMLHEMLYYMVLQYQDVGVISDSKIVRYLVSKLASADVGTWSLRSFVDVLRQLHFKYVTYHGYSFVVDKDNPDFWNTDSFKGGPLLGDGIITVQAHSVDVTNLEFDGLGNLLHFTPNAAQLLKVDGQDVWFQKGKSVTIRQDLIFEGYAMTGNKNVFKRAGEYELKLVGSVYQKPIHLLFKKDGRLMFCNTCEGTVAIDGQNYSVAVPTSYDEDHFASSSFYKWDIGSKGISIFLASPTSVKVAAQDVTFMGQLAFDGLGPSHISSGILANPTEFEVAGQKIRLSKGEVDFFGSGNVGFGQLEEDTTLTSIDGSQVPYLAGMKLYFTEAGLVQEVSPESVIRKTKSRQK